MKTYTLEVLADDDDELVATILDALRKRGFICFNEVSKADNSLILKAKNIKADVLLARQQPGLSRGAAQAQLEL